MNTLLLSYLLIINLVSGLFFIYDKKAAIKHKQRISEMTLHLLELCGGVFSIFILIYFMGHKNRKFTYFAITYLILSGWFSLLLAHFIII
ncbi:MAG: DUF1294 domain-containing protein [Bacteroidales bacterium]|nr:DUF1294 domain-containing protein [Bacteroidales bacterium]